MDAMCATVFAKQFKIFKIWKICLVLVVCNENEWHLGVRADELGALHGAHVAGENARQARRLGEDGGVDDAEAEAKADAQHATQHVAGRVEHHERHAVAHQHACQHDIAQLAPRRHDDRRLVVLHEHDDHEYGR